LVPFDADERRLSDVGAGYCSAAAEKVKPLGRVFPDPTPV
jgi:hypothetical protein